ncbi:MULTISPECIES: hypothetical protein [Clostridium]|jgi:hypothetical protein|uniref:hypothetical protein n=1 Tax=Clostridium TaxID=1485 RepID=UPI0002892172|nr:MULTISPECIES: hypothetical protein [Clostridium]EEH97772.2 hypothetical protein CSBG_01398 [Clostridium sp. 7_2_43FAA]MBS5308614.1 hypothetical protein [Clostridium sp.]MBU6135304.1 hypothetical protein [Clostridium tertium]MDB1946113.1 hypothetical protein [Clostridium tertium]MDB1953138.1 hypothetical protein [Clostridium tertium]
MLEKLNELKKEFFPKCEMIIDFNGIVSTSDDIKNILIEYCNKEKKNLVILKDDMTPIVKIDGEVYIIRADKFVGLIGGGRKLNSPYPLTYLGRGATQRLYVYPYEYNEDELNS